VSMASSELFSFEETNIEGVIVIHNHSIADHRGYLERKYCEETFSRFLGKNIIRQVNITQTVQKGTLRGLHYQIEPKSEFKILSCLTGKIFDVVTDLRPKSKTFLKHFAIELQAHMSILIPEKCAHGFQSLEDQVLLAYLHTSEYSSELERGIDALDPALAIRWPEPITLRSARDISLPRITDKALNL